MCKWVLLPDKDNPTMRGCDKTGEPYCEEHLRELEWIEEICDRTISGPALVELPPEGKERPLDAI